MEFSTGTYTSAAFKYSKQDMLSSIKKLDWLNYEVDPAWKRFCSFGPEDIGGPWEQLGIIRRKRQPGTMLIAQQEMIETLNNIAWDACIGFDRGIGGYFSAMSVISSPIVPPGKAYMISVPIAVNPEFYNPARGICFGSV